MAQQARSGLGGRRAVVVSVVAASLALAGCSAGQHAQTVGQVPPVDGVNADSGTVGIRYAGLETPENGKSWASGSDVPLQLILVNDGQKDDELAAVSTPAATDALLSGSANGASSIVVKAGQSLSVGIGEGAAEVVLKGIKSDLFPSQSIPVTFVFKSGAQIKSQLAVKLSEGERVDPTLSVKPSGQE